jgi:hypothetical protein
MYGWHSSGKKLHFRLCFTDETKILLHFVTVSPVSKDLKKYILHETIKEEAKESVFPKSDH